MAQVANFYIKWQNSGCKNRQMGLYQIKRLLHITIKRQLIKYLQTTSDKGLNPEYIYKKL